MPSFHTYLTQSGFTTTDRALADGTYSAAFDVTAEQVAQIDAGAQLSLFDGALAITPAPTPPPLPMPTVPESVRSAQLCQVLLEEPFTILVEGSPVQTTLFAVVEGAFDNPAAWPSELVRLQAKVKWERELNVRRNNPLVATLANSLNLSSTYVDSLFVRADAKD